MIYEIQLGLRYIRAGRGKGFVNFISAMATMGIALGVAALAAASETANEAQVLDADAVDAPEPQVIAAPSFEFEEDAQETTEVKEKVSTPGYFGDDLDLPEFFR